MRLKVGIAIACVVCALGGLGGIKFLQIQTLMAAGKAFAQPPESVAVFTVRQENWQGTLGAIGSITAAQGVTVTPELAGTITEIAFESGAVVAKDALLVRLDTSSEEAQLRAIKAQLDLAQINLDRTRKLRQDNMVPESDLDTAVATLKQTQANADNIQTIIDKKTIRAPFAGRLGIRQANLGQYLDAGKPIVSLQALTPAYADFSLPQQELGRLKTGMKVRLAIDAYPDGSFEGTLSAINPDLDQTTRSVGLRATFDNTNQLLRPGMYARVQVLLPESKDVLVIPITAVLSAPYGDSVYVIEPKTANTQELQVRQQFIRTGLPRGDFITVESGLKAGERVVSSGVFKLRNGMAVVESNAPAPKSSTSPNPADS
jgi:membrane fusion protein (multidrug efflux system)